MKIDMAFIEDITEILHQDFSCKANCFEEKSVKMCVQVDRTGCKSTVYKYDKELKREYKGGLFPFFEKRKDVCKICDYIVFAERDRQQYVILVELKRGSAATMQQLLAAELFAKYVVGTLNRVKKTAYEPNIRKVSIHGNRVRKKGTKEYGIKYDEHSHYICQSACFYLRSYLC